MSLKAFKLSFNRNITTLITGTGLAQLITIIFSPLLTRVYSEDQFGNFAFLLAICSILSHLVNGRYDVSIMLPKNEEDAINPVSYTHLTLPTILLV